MYCIHTGHLIYQFDGHEMAVSSVKFLSIELLLTGSLDKTINLWFLKDGSKLKMRGHRGSVLSLTAGNFIRQNEDLDESINQYIQDNKNSQKDELEINEH